MFHITMRRRRFLLMILFCEVALWVLTYYPDYLASTYFPAKAAAPPVPRLLPEEGITLLEHFTFDSAEELGRWQEKSFKGKTAYALAEEGSRRYLKAESGGACSGLYRAVQIEVTPDLFVEWSWRVRAFPFKAVPTRFGDRGQDDFAARVYLVFPGSNFFKSDVVEYLWDEHAPQDYAAPSPFSDRIKMIVARSGKPAGDGWITERRNVLDDYRRLFGKSPVKALGIVAVMSDSDNTATRTEADFGPIRIYRKGP